MRRSTRRIGAASLAGVLCALAFGAPAAIAAPPENDDFASARLIEGQLAFEFDTNADATAEPGEPAHAGLAAARSLWYRWTPSLSGAVTVDTCLSWDVPLDTVVAVYTGGALDALAPVASNDDSSACGPGSAASSVTFPATAGVEYRIAVDARATGTFELRLAARPENDDFADAEPFDVIEGFNEGSTEHATLEPGEPEHASGAGGHSVWYVWTADSSGPVLLDTCYSEADAALAVYEGDAVDALAEVAASDPSGCGAGSGSVLRFDAVAGHTYRLAVDGAPGSFVVWASRTPANDAFAAAELLPGDDEYAYLRRTDLATREPGEPEHGGDPGGHSVWYRWVAPSTGAASVDTCGASFDTVFAIYTGTAVDALTEVARGGGEAGACGERTLFSVTAGTEYRIAVDGRGGAAGELSLHVLPQPGAANDDMAAAQDYWGLPVQVLGHNAGATAEPGEPDHAGAPAAHSVWYRWHALQSGEVTVHTCGSRLDTRIGVYRGAGLEPVAAGDDAEGCGPDERGSRVAFPAQAGETYLIAVDTNAGATGDFLLTFTSVPANDAFESAALLPVTGGYVRAETSLATRQPGEPLHAGVPGGRSVWYRWTPATTGEAAFNTCANGSATVDTVVAVYTGASLDALTTVASGDDDAGCFDSDAASVTFHAVAGTEYRIAVDGKDGAGGFIEMMLTAPLANDAFAAATVVGDTTFPLGGSTQGASAEPGEPAHAGVPAARSVWYAWTATASGPVSLAVCGGFDSRLAVYTGSDLASLSEVAAADDGGTCGIGGSQLGFDAQAGTTYRIAVDAEHGTQGPFTLEFLSPPANDHFEAAAPITAPAVTFTVDNRTASAEAGEPAHAGSPAARSVWYRWTAPETGEMTLRTCGSSADTLLAVYTGTTLAGLSEVASSDDDAVACGPGATAGAVTFPATAGVEYRIAVDSKFGSGGRLVLGVNPPANDLLADAVALAGAADSVAGRLAGATAEGFASNASVWYRWTAPETGAVVLRTCGEGDFPRLAVYTGDAPWELEAVPVEHQYIGCYLGEVVRWTATAGTTYRIAVEGGGYPAGAFRLQLNPPANDDLSAAEMLPGRTAAATGDSTGAGRETFERDHAGQPGGRSVWYSWVAPSGGSGHATVDTCDTGFDTVLAVYRGTYHHDLVEVASDDDGCGLASTVEFDYEPGEQFRIAVDGKGGAGGPLTVHVNRVVEPPANDAFASAEPIAGSAATVRGDSTAATRETGEPEHAGQPGGASIWYRWTATADGEVRLDTCDSRFDTLLAVYSGDDLGALAPVAADDDGPERCGPGSNRSALTFTAQAGVEYRIAVDGKDGAAGAVTLGVNRPDNDDFARAQDILGATAAVPGTTAGASAEASEPAHDGLTARASVWYRWTAPATARVDLHTCSASGAPGHIAVYTGTELRFLSATVDNVMSSCGAGAYAAHVSFPAVAGTTYRIAVDAPLTPFGISDFVLLVNAPPNDLRAGATELLGTDPATTQTTAGASREPGEAGHAGDPGGASVWYRWYAPGSGTTTVETCGSGFDTLLEVEGIDADDDASDCDGSRVTFDAVAGTTYMIAVDGKAGASGALTLRIDGADDVTPPATSLFYGDPAVPATSWSYGVSADEPGARIECSRDGAPFAPCDASGSLTGLAEGEHTFAARAVDLAGLTDPTPLEVAFRVDLTDPQTTIDDGPADPTNAVGPQVAFSASEAARFECSTDGGPFEPCASPHALGGLGEGQHTVRVRAIDDAGNADDSPAERSFTIDRTPPETSALSGPPELVAASSVDIAFASEEEDARFECSLDFAAFEACEPPATFAGLDDGAHVLRARAVDRASNVDATPVSWSFRVDTTPPVTSFGDGPTGPTRDATPTFTFAANEQVTGFECSIDDGPLAACASPLTLAELPDGEHTVAVRATDLAGNVEPLAKRREFLVDTVAPATTITGGPEGLTNATPAFAFESDEPGASFECALDGGAFEPCASGRSWTVEDGDHTFAVRAVDAAGNVDAGPAERAFTLDTTPPETELTEAPEGIVTVATVEVAFAASEPGVTFRCSLDGTAYGPCESPWALADLPDGEHSVRVLARDPAGNVEPAAAERGFRVEARPPETTLTNRPPALVPVDHVDVAFTADEDATFECALDGGAFAACASPHAYEGLEDGEHEIAVRARDLGANADPTPATAGFRVDTTPPQTTIDGGPEGATRQAGPFTFAADEPADFACAIDDGPYAGCASPFTATGLEDGDHVVRVRATDAAGHTDLSPAERAFMLDTTPPAIELTAVPAPLGTAADVEVAFEVDDPDAAVECSLDSGDPAPCSSPARFHVADGTHSVSVRAVDAVGNEASVATEPFTVDTRAPQVTITDGPPPVLHERDAHLAFTVDESGAQAACRLDDGPWEACESPIDYTGLADGEHEVAVRATDRAGNEGAPATRAFTVAPNRPPTAALALDATAGVAPMAAAAAIDASDEDGDELTYTLSFGDGSAVRSGTLPAGPVTHSYGEAGSYLVRLTVTDGVETVTRTETVLVTRAEPLHADAGDDVQTVTGAAVGFDASNSRPGGAIEEYRWDFGDGSEATGPRAQHAYAMPGTYTARLTVRAGAETESDTATIRVLDPVAPGLDVRIRGGGVPLMGATAMIVAADGSRVSASSDSGGVAHLRAVPDGQIAVYAYAAGYRPRVVTATVSGGAGEVAVDLEPGQLGASTLESHRMSYQEIIDAGIDVADPENSHVYEATINLYFVPLEDVPEERRVHVYVSPEGVACASNCDGGGGGGGGGGGWGWGPGWGGGFTVGRYSYSPRVVYVQGEPFIHWLVLPVRASFLKEFFEVKLIVQNLTEGFSFSPGVADLQLPSGLSLAPTPAPQSRTQEVAAVPGGESRTVEWIVRGDVEGEYDLTANYSATVEPIGEPVNLRAETREPLKVWAASALRTEVLVDCEARRWAPYRLDVRVTNITDAAGPDDAAPVYNMQIEMLDRPADAPATEAKFFYAPAPPQVQGTPVIEPGDTWQASYTLFAGIGSEDIPDVMLLLEQSFIQRTGGDVDLRPELGCREGPPAGPAAGPIDVRLVDADPDRVELSWGPPDGATGYELWTRQALVGGAWERYRTDLTAAHATIGAHEAARGRYYAIGTRFADGRLEFLHELGVGPSRYVSLGDSFSAGEGVPAFEPQTDRDGNRCHRSERGAYGRILVEDETVDANLSPATFRACSGAVARDIDRDNGENDDEPPQLGHVSDFTDVVSLSVGGNDIGFKDIGVACVLHWCSDPTLGPLGGEQWFRELSQMWVQGEWLSSKLEDVIAGPQACVNPLSVAGKIMCAYKLHKSIKAAEDLIEYDPQRIANPLNLVNDTLVERLTDKYAQLADEAPNARIYVQRYPHLVTDDDDPGTCDLLGLDLPLIGKLDTRERRSIRTIVDKLNDAAAAAVVALGADDEARFKLVDPNEEFEGHELCRGGTVNSTDRYFRSVVNPVVDTPEEAKGDIAFSFHPNDLGQRAYARALANAMQGEIAAHVLHVHPRETVDAGTVFVPYGGRTVRAEASWPGSTVTVSLVSPSGTTYDAGSPGVRSGTTATTQWLELDDPEPGTWRVRTFGDDVDPAGEPVSVSAYASTPVRRAPEIAIDAVAVDGEPGTYDLTADGPAGTTYQWTFSDGETAAGATVRHAFAADGPRWAALRGTLDGLDGHATVDLGVAGADTTAPSIGGVPAGIRIEAAGPDGATVDYQPPAAFDDRDGSLDAACAPAPGARFPLGTTTVTCTATDAAGNDAQATFEVVVEDTADPTFAAAPDDVVAEATEPAGARVSFEPPRADDLVDTDVAVECEPASGSIFALGATTVECAAEDDSGNAATISFTVTVRDTTAPALAGVPGDVTVPAEGAGGAHVSYGAPTATDLVSGARPVTCSPASGSLFGIGTTRVTCAAADAAGNSVSRGFGVTVTAPPPASPPPASPPPPTVEPSPPAADAPVIKRGPRKVTAKRSGAVRLGTRVSCPGDGPACVARVTLKRGRKTIGRIKATVRAGRSVKLKGRLNRAGRKLLRGRKQVKVRAVISVVRGGEREKATVTFTLRAPRRR